jgi:hypothetical protein
MRLIGDRQSRRGRRFGRASNQTASSCSGRRAGSRAELLARCRDEAARLQARPDQRPGDERRRCEKSRSLIRDIADERNADFRGIGHSFS